MQLGSIWRRLLLPQSKYNDVAQRQFARDLVTRLKTQPGITTAGATTSLPLAGGGMIFLTNLPDGKRAAIYFHSITPDYFSAMEMPIVRGRGFTDADSANAPKVAIISESAAKQLFPDQDPIGKTMTSGFTKEPPTIVGVVRDVRGASLVSQKLPEMYLPFEQKPWPFLRIAVRGTQGQNGLAAVVREQVHAIDKDEPVDKIRMMDAVVGQSIATQRFYMLLLASFAAVAVGLALVGIYGVVSFDTSQRTHEIGIRMALGARPAQIFHMIVGQGVMPAVVGLAFGIAGAFATTKLLKSLIFGVTTTDPFTFAIVPAVLIASALLATILPARRAVKVDPMIALRYE